MSDSHISRLLGLKEKLEDLGSNLGDSVIFSEPFKFFFLCVSSGARWNTRRVCSHLCMANPRYSPEFGGWVG